MMPRLTRTDRRGRAATRTGRAVAASRERAAAASMEELEVKLGRPVDRNFKVEREQVVGMARFLEANRRSINKTTELELIKFMTRQRTGSNHHMNLMVEKYSRHSSRPFIIEPARQEQTS
jgi:hypothetical protein